jgi:CheY-like chemotaxis protein
MPICDGFTATKRIRQLETDGPNPSKPHSPSTSPQLPSQSDSAVPIFAVSASLLENQYDQLITCGFSGFILKPINFARLQDLMRGTYDPAALDANQYIPGRWEKGGWLQGSSLPSNESTA